MNSARPASADRSLRTFMRYFALACDYDGTLADEGTVSPTTLAAVQRFKDSGRKAILVTGRQLDDLMQVFPDHAICDRIVADNGAVLYSPASREMGATKERAGGATAPARDRLDALDHSS